MPRKTKPDIPKKQEELPTKESFFDLLRKATTPIPKASDENKVEQSGDRGKSH